MLLIMKKAPHRRAVRAIPPPYNALIPPSLYTFASAVLALGYVVPAISLCMHVFAVSTGCVNTAATVPPMPQSR